MKKNIYSICCLILFALCCEAQYTIPGASQQPAWVFPIWIEDSIGQKDTVYLGYDPIYSYVFGCFDEGIFNEQFEYFDPTDTTKMKAFVCWSVAGPGMDSISRVNVHQVISTTLWVHACYYPIKLKWDSQLFYSDSLPYPDQDPLPRAQGRLDWDFFPNIVQGCISNYYPVLMTDTCNNYPCCYVDSVIVFGQGSNGGVGLSHFSLAIAAWTGMIPLNIKDNSNLSDVIYPNVLKSGDEIKINKPLNYFEVAEIYNLNGKLILSKPIFSNSIKITDLERGFYFMCLIGKKEKIVTRIIIY